MSADVEPLVLAQCWMEPSPSWLYKEHRGDEGAFSLMMPKTVSRLHGRPGSAMRHRHLEKFGLQCLHPTWAN